MRDLQFRACHAADRHSPAVNRPRSLRRWARVGGISTVRPAQNCRDSASRRPPLDPAARRRPADESRDERLICRGGGERSLGSHIAHPAPLPHRGAVAGRRIEARSRAARSRLQITARARMTGGTSAALPTLGLPGEDREQQHGEEAGDLEAAPRHPAGRVERRAAWRRRASATPASTTSASAAPSAPHIHSCVVIPPAP